MFITKGQKSVQSFKQFRYGVGIYDEVIDPKLKSFCMELKHWSTCDWKCTDAFCNPYNTSVDVNSACAEMIPHASYEDGSRGICQCAPQKSFVEKHVQSEKSASSASMFGRGQVSFIVAALSSLRWIVSRYIADSFSIKCGAACHEALCLAANIPLWSVGWSMCPETCVAVMGILQTFTYTGFFFGSSLIFIGAILDGFPWPSFIRNYCLCPSMIRFSSFSNYSGWLSIKESFTLPFNSV